jgi:hypothetical protein
MRGRSLAHQVRRAGRLLPRRVRQDLQFLMRSAALARNPKLQRMIDENKVHRAHRDIGAYLQALDARERLKTRILGIMASISLALIGVFALVVFVLVQRGYL